MKAVGPGLLWGLPYTPLSMAAFSRPCRSSTSLEAMSQKVQGVVYFCIPVSS